MAENLRPKFMIDINFHSPDWHRVRKWAETELERLRIKNDAVGLTDIETAALRGEIRAIKKLIGLPEVVARGVVVDPGGSPD